MTHAKGQARPAMRDMLDIIHWSCNDECDEESHVFTPAEQGIYKALFEHVLGIVAVQVGEVAAEWSRTVDATVHEAERQVAQAKAEALRDAVKRGSIEFYEPGGLRTAAVLASWLLAEASLSIFRPAAPSEEARPAGCYPPAGLYEKYRVERASDPTGKHDDCRYFVLDPQHDPGAIFALRSYGVWARRNGHEALADDIANWLNAPPSEGSE